MGDYELVIELRRQLSEASARIDALTGALERLQAWADAYPLTVFPEPDFKRAHEVLGAAGMTLDAISASNMRHVIEQTRAIVNAALAPAESQPVAESRVAQLQAVVDELVAAQDDDKTIQIHPVYGAKFTIGGEPTRIEKAWQAARALRSAKEPT